MNESSCSIRELVPLDSNTVQLSCNYRADSSVTHIDTSTVPRDIAQIGLQGLQLASF